VYSSENGKGDIRKNKIEKQKIQRIEVTFGTK
jgi:hypothetical protein